ncbi:NmrA family NAD(P)-binding protein [Streptomyces blattellae]|uniref:NmrA family NAD(P)-binding protein n=1 Tax=Streptomyces blattellae TaxID=2569855 RepID=UPI0012B7F96A|nr:NmrA family NAD(P)-binding protein [Streptomyces blattellae]
MTKNTQNTTVNTQNTTVVVTGASGRTGSRVADALRGAGLTVRAASRTRGFDWEDPTTWAETLRDADAAYVVYPSDVGSPAAAEGVGALAREAVGLGVRRLVLLSARGEEQALAAEEALMSSGAEWTIVRCAWFAQNFSEGLLAEGLVQTGEFVFPAAEVPEPFLDVRDIGDVVAAVLTSGDRYVGRTLDLTGPRMLSFREAVAEIDAATGSGLTYTPVPARSYGKILTGMGVPAEEADFLVEVFEGLLDGRNAHVTDGVRQVLGRQARDFSEFVRESAAAGAWKR